MVTLRKFISQTLSDISGAVEDFNQEREDGSAVAVPDFPNMMVQANVARSGSGFIDFGTAGYGIPVEFDVAVTVEEKTGAKTGGKIDIKVMGIGGDYETAGTNSSISRTSFKIPLCFNDARVR
ncbi:hypothetical protein [Kiloniella antarctica]|uniref:Uncharacterized protein n=1 Tax=Kiloniella antarctica TaxID=1550907 RepID=A0ABW5BIE4_9PROT